MTHHAPLPEVRVALLAGATGLVGQQLLRLLLKDPLITELRVLVRRPMTAQDLVKDPAMASHLPKLKVLVSPFEQIDQHPEWFKVDAVFCALGTTIKQAGSQAAFRLVDFDYPLSVAQLARAQGVRHYLLVSALGADARSRVFYSRVKGELENALKALSFDALTFARPSLLKGDRPEFRLGEVLALRLAFITPEAYKPVDVRQVALALWQSARRGQVGLHTLNNTAMRRLSAGPHASAPT
jgi:uncharacterized protein YbjT (DUF2867 family)